MTMRFYCWTFSVLETRRWCGAILVIFVLSLMVVVPWKPSHMRIPVKRLQSHKEEWHELPKMDNETWTVPQFNFGSLELEKHLTFCSDDHVVPNIVHFVWLSEHEFRFHHLISFLSAFRYQNPCFILIHGDVMPYGPWWRYVMLRMRHKLIHVYRKAPESIFGNEIKGITHKGDICKMEAIKEYGGIYMDADQILLRSLDPLRGFDYTAGLETNDALGAGLIIGKKNAPFLQLWYLSFLTFNDTEWGNHPVLMPFKLSQLFPQLIHVEIGTFYKPTWRYPKLIFEENYDWSKSYALHLYFRFYNKDHNPQDIKDLDTTIGSVYRHVFFGNQDLMKRNATAVRNPMRKVI